MYSILHSSYHDFRMVNFDQYLDDEYEQNNCENDYLIRCCFSGFNVNSIILIVSER